MPRASLVQVAPDSTGKKISNLQMEVLQTDGSIATVQLQIISIADENGNPMRVVESQDVAQQMLDEMRATRIGMQMLVEWLHPMSNMIQPTQLQPRQRGMLGHVFQAPIPLQPEENDLLEMAQNMRDDEIT